MEFVQELIATIGFPSVIVFGVGIWLRQHLDAQQVAGLARESMAAADRKSLGQRISELENRQFDKVAIKNADSNRRTSDALNAIASAIAHAPCATITVEQACSATRTPLP
jgi:hypothetical protein